MAKINYAESVEKGLAHLGRRTPGTEVDALNEGRGSRRGCLGNLSVGVEPMSLRAWFKDHDLRGFKQWAYVAAKVNRMIFQMEPGSWFPAYEHLYALMSDCEAMVDWYRQHRVSYFLEGEIKDRDNPKQAAFHGYQALLALNGKWDLLRQRCEQILSADLKRDRKFLVDHRFYLALANGDKAGMEAALNELTSPKVARIRNFALAFGFTENLIATHATIYAKIAWRHGYEVEVDSPWVPKEWLPIQPLDHYEDPWPFMQDFDLWQPFEGDWAPWSPKPSLK